MWCWKHELCVHIRHRVLNTLGVWFSAGINRFQMTPQMQMAIAVSVFSIDVCVPFGDIYSSPCTDDHSRRELNWGKMQSLTIAPRTEKWKTCSGGKKIISISFGMSSHISGTGNREDILPMVNLLVLAMYIPYPKKWIWLYIWYKNIKMY